MTDDRDTFGEVRRDDASAENREPSVQGDPARPAHTASDAAGSASSAPDASDLHSSSAAEPVGPDPSVSDGAAPAETGVPAHAAAPADAAVPADSAALADETVPTDETRRQRRKREKAATPRRKAPWWELPLLVAVAIGIAILVKSFVVQPFYIPSESMEKTLHGCNGCSGDRILVNKPIYSVFRDPDPGDIVVFDAPKGWDDETPEVHSDNPVAKVVRGFGQLVGVVPPDGEVLVKRVIAVGGQTIRGVEAKDANGLTIDRIQISTNGASGPWRTLDEPFTYRGGGQSEQAFGPVTVPKGRLWVMGDHRNDSQDSRYHCTPGGSAGLDNEANCDPTSSTVPIDKVIGKATVIAWPPSRWRTLGTPSTFESAADAAGPGLPSVVSLGAVVPVFLVRRRRRRTR